MPLNSIIKTGRLINLKPKAKISTVVKILITVSLRKFVRTPFLKPQAKPSSHINIKIKKV